MIAQIIKDVRRLLTYMSGAKTQLFAGVILFAVCQFLFMWMFADLLGNGVAAYQARSMPDLVRAVLGALSYLLAALLLQGISDYLIGVATARGTVAMRNHVFETILTSPLSQANRRHSGLILSYITNDIPAAMDAMVSTLVRPVFGVIMGIGSLIYVLRVNWVMSIVAIGIGLATLAYSLFFAGWLHRIAQKIQAMTANLEIKIKDLIDGMVTVRTYGMRDEMEEDMLRTSIALRREGIRWAWASGLLGGTNNAVYYLTDRVLVFVAGLFVLGGSLNLPELMRVSQMAGGIVGIFHVSRALVSIQKSLAGAQRVFGYLDDMPEQPVMPDAEAHPDDAVAVSFDRVKFSYGVAPVIDNLSFDVRKGELVALIGPSGTGKSTVLRLIQGLYTPDDGTIRVWGRPVESWNPEELRHKTALVPQEPVLFPGTIAENISMGNDRERSADLMESARLANADFFINEMPDGYQTSVAERGASLSGGERQRIALARALCRDADILLLDEATSALDAHSEAVVHEALSRLKGKKTILYVTHRASAVKIADRVISI